MRVATTRIVTVLFAILLVSSILCPKASFSKAETPPTGPDLLWNQTYRGEWSDVATCLAPTSDGGFALAGSTYCYGSGAFKYFWLVKTDGQGNMQWNKTFGGPPDDCVPNSLVETPDGGFVLAGKTNFTITFIVRTDANGNLMWDKTYHEGYVSSIIATSDGSFAMVGATSSSSFVGTWLAKVDSSGDLKWNKTLAGPGLSACESLVETPDGGFALAGSVLNWNEKGAKIEEDFWLVKTDGFGNMLWSQKYGGNDSEVATHVIKISDGGFLLAGFLSLSETQRNFWLVKTDAIGTMIWNKTISDADPGYYFSVIETLDGGLALVGGTNSVDSLNCSFWLAKMDAFGNQRWNQTYFQISNPRDYARASAVVQATDFGFVIAGYKSSLSGDTDFCLIKTKPDTDIQSKNVIKISVAMAPAFSNSDIVANFIESGKIIDTYVRVTVNENANLVNSVKMKYVSNNGSLSSTAEVKEMQIQSDSLYQCRVEAYASGAQDSALRAHSLAEYLMVELASFYGQTSSSLAQTISSSGILDYSLSEIVIVDTNGMEHSFYFDLPIKSIPSRIAEMSDGTYVITLSPVDSIITDSLGRNIGCSYKLQNGNTVFVEAVNQIPGAYFNRDAKFFYLPSSISNYNISFVGLEKGFYQLVTLAGNGVKGNLQENITYIQKGEIQSFNTRISENGKPIINLISPLPLPVETFPPAIPVTTSEGLTDSKSSSPLNLSIEWFLTIISAVAVAVAVTAYRVRAAYKARKG
jgi:WD40 repeat protein